MILAAFPKVWSETVCTQSALAILTRVPCWSPSSHWKEGDLRVFSAQTQESSDLASIPLAGTYRVLSSFSGPGGGFPHHGHSTCHEVGPILLVLPRLRGSQDAGCSVLTPGKSWANWDQVVGCPAYYIVSDFTCPSVPCQALRRVRVENLKSDRCVTRSKFSSS